MQVAREGGATHWYSGERVSNAWVTYPRGGNNPPKGGLMPRTLPGLRLREESCPMRVALEAGLTSYQLVGRVTAYQGCDG